MSADADAEEAPTPPPDEASALIDAADAVADDPAGADEAQLERAVVRCHERRRAATDVDARERWSIAHKRVLRALSARRRYLAEHGVQNSHGDTTEVPRDV